MFKDTDLRDYIKDKKLKCKNIRDLEAHFLREVEETKHCRSGEERKAIFGTYREAMGNRSYWTLRFRYALMLAQTQGDPREAGRACEPLARQYPQAMPPYKLLFDLLVSQGRFPEALTCCRRILAYRPQSEEVLTDMATVSMLQGEVRLASRYAKEALRANPFSGRAHHCLAMCEIAQRPGDREAERQAVEHLRQGFDSNLAEPEARRSLAEMYGLHASRLSGHGRFQDARALLLRALELDQGSAPAHFALGQLICASRLGTPQEALNHLSEALRIDPSLQEARALLEDLRNSLQGAGRGRP